MICRRSKISFTTLASTLLFLLMLPFTSTVPIVRSQEPLQNGSSTLIHTASGDIAAILPIQGVITDVTVESLQRRIEAARSRHAKVIVFDMDTPGGLVTSSIAVADLIRELTDIKTVAWVNPNAHSGGSLIAVACDEIIMSRSSRIGDSQVIMGGPVGAGEIPDELKPKAYTPVLADFRMSARLNGYSHVLCESFVLPKKEVWWIEHKTSGDRKFVFGEEKARLFGETIKVKTSDSESKEESDNEPDEKEVSKIITGAVSSDRPGEWKLVETNYDILLDKEVDTIQPVVRDDQLLEMTAGDAFAFGFSKGIVSNENVLKTHYGLASTFRIKPTWSEALAYWLTSMYVRGFLMLIIFLGAYVEFHTPGVGVPGLVALICLSIFVGAP